MTLKVAFLITTIPVFLAINIGCKKKKTNQKLYDEASASGHTFYKNKDTLYSPKGGSPHGHFKLKFNSQAVGSLDGTGKLPDGGSFSNGSLLIKEVYKNGSLSLYAVMKKDPKSKFSAKDWVWAEYDPTGKTIYDASKKGESCVSCHSSGANRDYTRSFELH